MIFLPIKHSWAYDFLANKVVWCVEFFYLVATVGRRASSPVNLTF